MDNARRWTRSKLKSSPTSDPAIGWLVARVNNHTDLVIISKVVSG